MIHGLTGWFGKRARPSAWARSSVAALLAIMAGTAAWSEPPRPGGVISLDYCADQYVLALADRSQIKGLSRGADKGYSFFADQAKDLPRLYGTIDEVLYHQPDVIVQTWGLSGRMKEIAGSRGIVAIEAEYGSDPDIVFRNVSRIGAAFGQDARANALIAEYRGRLEQLAQRPPLDVRAAYVTPSGFTSGTGTFVDEIIKLAGFQSWAASRDLKGWQVLPLEDLILDPPDLFVASFFDTNMATQSNWSIARHGRLYDMIARTASVDLPGRYLACNGLFLAGAATRIRDEAEAILSARTEADEKGKPVR